MITHGAPAAPDACPNLLKISESAFCVGLRLGCRCRRFDFHEKVAGQYPAASRAQNCLFSKMPVRPGYARLAFASGARRIKTALPSKEQRSCGGESTHSISRICSLGLLGKCDSDQARAQQYKTCNGHSEETVRGEFFTHGTPPIARECWLPSRPRPARR
jgi:hypothetical protein